MFQFIDNRKNIVLVHICSTERLNFKVVRILTREKKDVNTRLLIV